MGTSAHSGKLAFPAALLCAALAMGMTACGGGATTAQAKGTSARPTSNPLSGLSADDIASKAFTDLRTASTVHVAGAIKDSGQEIVLMNMTLVHGQGCQGTFALQGKGSLRLVMIGKLAWLKADSLFLKNYGGGADPAVLSFVSSKYIKTTASSTLGHAFSGLCDPGQLASRIAGNLGVKASGVVKGTTTTISGQPALQLTQTAYSDRLDVSISTLPRILRIEGVGANSGHVDFTAYDSPVHLAAPPASETLDGPKYGF